MEPITASTIFLSANREAFTLLLVILENPARGCTAASLVWKRQKFDGLIKY